MKSKRKRQANVKKHTTSKSRKASRKSRAKRTPHRQSRKKSLSKGRPSKALRHARKGQRDKVQKARHRTAKRKQPFQKRAYKAKVSAKAKGRTRSSPGKAGSPSRKAQVTTRHSRTEPQITLGFKGVRSIDKKLATLKGSPSVSKAIRSQLERKEGRPPRGAVVIVADKDGNQLSFPTPPDMVVNEVNLQKFMEEKAHEMAKDHTKWRRFRKGQARARKLEEDFVDTDSDANPYGEFNPNGITNITIKFIYGK